MLCTAEASIAQRLHERTKVAAMRAARGGDMHSHLAACWSVSIPGELVSISQQGPLRLMACQQAQQSVPAMTLQPMQPHMKQISSCMCCQIKQ